MDVAGVALGALPIALYAIDNYHRCLKPAKNYLYYKSTLQEIRRNLFVQQQQLQVTLENIGLRNPTLDQTQEKLRQLYPECHDEFMGILNHMDQQLATLMVNLDVDFTGKPKWTEDAPERASWEWRKVRRSFQHTERRELFDELQHWNTAMKNCLERKREIPSEESDPLITSHLHVFDLNSCDAARDTARIIHEALSAAWNEGCTDKYHSSDVDLIWHQKGLNTTSQLNLTIPQPHIRTQMRKIWRQVCIDVKTTTAKSIAIPSSPSVQAPIPQLCPTPTPTARRHSPMRYWKISRKVDFLRSTQSPVSLLPEQEPEPEESNSDEVEDSQLITSLCTVMHGEEWGGHLIHSDLQDKKVINIKNRASSREPRSILSLSEVLVANASRPWVKSQSSIKGLSRRDRLAIAAAIAWGVLLLCDTPWLTNPWLNKEDITLIIDEDVRSGPSNRLVTYPALAYTFQSQTITLDKAKAEPSNSFQGNQIRNKTLFALGIILIELGLGKPFESFRAEARADGLEASGSPQDDYVIANSIIDNQILERELSMSYANAVQRCIQCIFLGSESTQNFSHASFKKQFYAGVVAPLQATYDGQITSTSLLQSSQR